MKVFLASDHTGLELKEHLKEFLSSKEYEVEDCGAYEYDKDDDYPDFIAKAAEGVSRNRGSFGVVIGGSGQGEAMTANKELGIRCALFYAPAIPATAVDISGRESTDPFEIIKLTRQHNNANMLSLSARFLTFEESEQAVLLFLETPFSGEERHQRRVEKIAKLENV